MLNITNLHAYYGQIEALKGVNLRVEKGKITCLIGSNGAGKTTLLKSISGMMRRSGSIVFNDSGDGGEEMIERNPHYIAKRGIIHVPEGRRVFPGLTVYENLETGTINWHGFFGRKPYDREIEEVYELFPRLKERSKQLAWSLSGGEQQMLAIGRAIMARPNVLLMDEPSMGLAPVIVRDLFEKIIKINQRGIPILLVEQNARIALQVSHYAYVIDGGQMILEGESKALSNDDRVMKAYLGKFAREK